MPVSISIDMLSAFVKVAQRRSVSVAAADLGVSKSVVSKRVGQLENAVQATLFARSTRRVALTTAGEAYFEHACRALAELSGAQERVRAARADLAGRIRLTAPVNWGQRVLARRLPLFLQRHPAIEIDLQLTDRRMDLAAEGIDMAMRWTGTPPAELAMAPLARIDWLLAAAPTYLASAGEPDDPAALASHSCLGYWQGSADETWTLAGPDGTCVVRARGRYHADNADAVAEAALAGLGIAMLPDYLCADALTAGRLARVLPHWRLRTRFGEGIVAVAPPERMRLQRNRALLKFLQESS